MAGLGQLQRFDSAREASGVPPIASEFCALHRGANGPIPEIIVRKTLAVASKILNALAVRADNANLS